jgi:hypothetical protein
MWRLLARFRIGLGAAKGVILDECHALSALAWKFERGVVLREIPFLACYLGSRFLYLFHSNPQGFNRSESPQRVYVVVTVCAFAGH